MGTAYNEYQTSDRAILLIAYGTFHENIFPQNKWLKQQSMNSVLHSGSDVTGV